MVCFGLGYVACGKESRRLFCLVLVRIGFVSLVCFGEVGYFFSGVRRRVGGFGGSGSEDWVKVGRWEGTGFVDCIREYMKVMRLDM